MPDELVPDPVPDSLGAPLAPLATGVEAAIATDLAAEYLARLEDGEAVDIEEILARAPDEGVRRAVRELVAGVATAKRGLPRAPTAGSVFHGRYEIVRQIGEGGMGRVYLAKDRELGRLVALKIMSSLGREERDRQAMLLKESRLLALLQHPNIVAVHDCGLEDELAWLVMDYVDGRSLADLVERMQDEVERSKSGRIATREGALWTRAIDKPGRRAPRA